MHRLLPTYRDDCLLSFARRLFTTRSRLFPANVVHTIWLPTHIATELVVWRYPQPLVSPKRSLLPRQLRIKRGCTPTHRFGSSVSLYLLRGFANDDYSQCLQYDSTSCVGQLTQVTHATIRRGDASKMPTIVSQITWAIGQVHTRRLCLKLHSKGSQMFLLTPEGLAIYVDWMESNHQYNICCIPKPLGQSYLCAILFRCATSNLLGASRRFSSTNLLNNGSHIDLFSLARIL